jgi:pyroglutamyl-peptidase
VPNKDRQANPIISVPELVRYRVSEAECDNMILVTGFGPYQQPMNASGELVNSLQRDLPEELVPLKEELAFEVISCDDSSRDSEHQSLEAQLAELLKKYRPTVCIHTGQAPPYNKVTIEKIAINSFMREVIDPARPVAYWSTLPGTGALKALLENNNIPAGYSFYCGQHLCNHILYSSLHFAEKSGKPHKAGFIHIPLLPEQVTKQHRDSPYMPIEMSRKALLLVINHVAGAYRLGANFVPQL